MDDRQLIEKIISGDMTAYQGLIKQYERLVATMINRYVDTKEDREELMQDVFVKVYQKLGEFRFQSRLSTWIATISYRQSIEFLRKKNKYTGEELKDGKIAQDLNFDKLEKADYSAFIKDVISRLPPAYASVITLYHLEGFSYKELVEILDMPEGTVKNYLFRARKELKKILKPILDKEDLLYEY